MSSILSRFRVVDLARIRSGPTCVRMLSDWGADVVAVERPAQESPAEAEAIRHNPDFQNLHRNKRSITLDFKSPQGMDVLMRLLDTADVVVENFRPDVKHRLGIDYETLKARNPRIIYASISGFGETGPYADRPGVDQVAQGMGGLMSITGEPGRGPMRVGIPICDLSAGIFAAYGVVLALLEREQSGEGQWIQTSLLAAQIAMLDFQATRWLIGGEVPDQAGNNHPTGVPTGVFRTADGHINIAPASNAMYRRMCAALDSSELANEPAYATARGRLADRDRLNDRIEAITITRPSAWWVERMNAEGVPCGPINTIDQVFADPQVQHLDLVGQVQHPKMGPLDIVGSAIRMSRSQSQLRSAAPEAGADTRTILAELGFGAGEIDAILTSGATGNA